MQTQVCSLSLAAVSLGEVLASIGAHSLWNSLAIIRSHSVRRMGSDSFKTIISLRICCSVPQLCPTLCDLIDCSLPGFPVLHHLLKLVQTHVHWVGDAVQPSHPLLSPSPSLEGLMLGLKLQYFGHLMWRTISLEKTLMLGKIEGKRRRGRQRMRWLEGVGIS